MRVLHFFHRAPPEYSGASLQALTLLEALHRRADGPELSAVAFAREPDRSRFPSWLEGRAIGLGRSPLARLTHRRALRRAIRNSPAEILHVHGYYRPAVAAGLAAGKRVLLKTTMLGVDDGASIAARSRADRALVSRVARLLSLTPALSAANRGIAPEVRIPNGIDLTRWDREAARSSGIELRARLELPSNSLLFLYTGGGYPRKGVRELPALWRAIASRLAPRPVHLLACGEFLEPQTSAWLQGELAGIGSATLVPRVLPDPVPLVAAADILLFLSAQEGLPNAVLEAVTMDTFVFAREIPGTYDGLLDASNGLRVPALDGAAVDALAACIEAEGHRRASNRAQRERFDIERIATRYLELYREVLAE